MRKLAIAILFLFIIMMLPSCSNENRSFIDMEDILKKTKNDKTRLKNSEKARKSIFPNLKD